MKTTSRALLIVLDSVGVGHAPDADDYGDAGANTLGHLLQRRPDLQVPHLDHLGLRTALALAANEPPPPASDPPPVGVLTARSAGKDTTTGHWELAGVILEEPFATFTEFPAALVAAIEAEAGVTFLGNKAASGTKILEELGPTHIATGEPILYTSADSVLQIAAHEEIFPPEQLYDLCRIARRHADAYRIGRVIARPFLADDGQFERTDGRRDFSIVPPRTVLNELQEAGVPVTGIGKISDIFAGSGISASHPTASNADGMQTIDRLWAEEKPGLLFANLVDFDMLYGHRRDVEGYARALEEFDRWLGTLRPRIAADDLVLITADHGNDPTWPGTDHTRERVPLICPRPQPTNPPGLSGDFSRVAAILRQFFG